MQNILAMILAGGQGDRLSILSEQRAKPAVVFGGHYRIIDFALSNVACSGIEKVAVLTQYRPRSLVNHIGSGRAWGLDNLDNSVQILQPYLGRQDMDWYQGTADAVYQNLYYIEESRAQEILILAGDHIYLTSYRNMIAFHRSHGADATVAVYSVPRSEAHRFGVLDLDDDGRIIDFQEKPQDPKSPWVSMGVYCFNKDALVEQLQLDADAGDDSKHDFGRNIIPRMFERHRVYGYQYQGYWRDVGTVESYHEAHMDLLRPDPLLHLDEPSVRLRTSGPVMAPARFGSHARFVDSLVSPGAQIDGTVERSVISPGVVVEAGAVVRDSVVQHRCVIRAGAVVDRAILDKEVSVGPGAVIGEGDEDVPNRERPDIVNSGITIVGKRVTIPGGLRAGRNVVIGPGVEDELVGKRALESGATIHPTHVPLHLFVFTRFYTLAEARDLLPRVIPVLEQLRDGVARLHDLQAAAGVAADRASGNGHVHADPFAPALSARDQLEKLEQEMRAAAAKLDEWGIELKDASRGLIDFYAYRGGEPVFLCYVLGEPGIGFWHSLEGGFAGRQPIDFEET